MSTILEPKKSGCEHERLKDTGRSWCCLDCGGAWVDFAKRWLAKLMAKDKP